MSAPLSIRHLRHQFAPGTVNAKTALDDFSLEVAAGEFVTILGSNGAGKSTLFNAILGRFQPDGGRVILDGEDITFRKDYRRALHIGCLYQDPMRGTAPHMTIEENLALAYTRKASRSFFAVNRRDSAYFRQLLARLGLGLEDRMKTKMGLLSGGQRQAVSLLMATIAQPKLLLLDEHTAALDPATASQVMAITKEIVAENQLTTLMITHNMQQALDCGHRTIMMDGGRLVLDLSGDRRQQATVQELIGLFSAAAAGQLADRTLFSAGA